MGGSEKQGRGPCNVDRGLRGKLGGGGVSPALRGGHGLLECVWGVCVSTSTSEEEVEDWITSRVVMPRNFFRVTSRPQGPSCPDSQNLPSTQSEGRGHECHVMKGFLSGSPALATVIFGERATLSCVGGRVGASCCDGEVRGPSG